MNRSNPGFHAGSPARSHGRLAPLRAWALRFGLLAAAGMAVASAQSVDTVITNGLAEPYAVVVDVQNNYYISDSANHRIAVFRPSTGALTNVAGRIGQNGYVDGSGVFARFYSPQGLAIANRAGLGTGLMVADSGNHAIRFVGFDGSVRTLAGGPNSGFVDGPGASAQFNAPAGLAADANGNVFIADALNNAIRRLSVSNVVTTLATNFLKPSAIAVGDNGQLYVADTGDHSIKVIAPNASSGVLLAGGDSRFLSGNLDSIVATDARFNSPRGLLWVGGQLGLLVSDSGNSLLRRVYFNASLNLNSVETFDGTATAGLSTPVGLARDLDGNILIADLGNNNLRSIGTSQGVQPPVANPIIGTIALTNSATSAGTLLSPVTNATFNNDVVVGILSEPGTQTFYTAGPSDNLGSIPDPTSANSVPPPYQDGSLSLPPSIIDPIQPDVTVKAIGTQTGRRPSSIVIARFRFQVANPSIIGNNPASFSLATATQNAELWYTTGGLVPTNDPAIATLYGGGNLNVLNDTNNVTFSVRAFKSGYLPSAVIQQIFYYTNLQNSVIGVPRDFTAGVGATIVAPVEVKPAANQVIQSLQFRVEVSPEAGAPALAAPLTALPFGPNDFIPVPTPGPNPVNSVLAYTTNGSTAGLAVAYLGTNANFFIAGRSTTVAMLAIPIPRGAQIGQSYRVTVLNASATSDGLQSAAAMVSLNPVHIAVTNISYLVGDSAPASWYNAGEFGGGALDNSDVNNAFYASIGVRVPYPFTDVFDAMDVFPIDSPGRVGGDGQIRFLDWQYLLRRALGLDTNRWQRSWSAAGVRVSSAAPNRSPAGFFAKTASNSAPAIVWSKQVLVGALPVENVTPGTLVQVPIFVKIADGSNLSGLQIWPTVAPTGTAPPLSQPMAFAAAPGITNPSAQDALGNKVYVWNVGAFNPPLTGSNLLGYLSFTTPGAALPGQSYTVSFANVDGSPKEEVTYEFETLHAGVWIQSPAAEPMDFISDDWKLAFFGSLSNPLAAAGADPDGDGLPNSIEYHNGANPTNPDGYGNPTPAALLGANSGLLKLAATPSDGVRPPNTFALRWTSLRGTTYAIESAANLNTPLWTGVATNWGNGYVQGIVQTNRNDAARFYRVRATP